MGKMPGRVLMAGGPDLEEDDLKESSLWVQSLVRVRKRMGLAHPSRLYFSFVRRTMGRRSLGIPHYNCASWSEVGKG